jgi:hypothetical protein
MADCDASEVDVLIEFRNATGFDEWNKSASDFELFARGFSSVLAQEAEDDEEDEEEGKEGGWDCDYGCGYNGSYADVSTHEAAGCEGGAGARKARVEADGDGDRETDSSLGSEGHNEDGDGVHEKFVMGYNNTDDDCEQQIGSNGEDGDDNVKPSEEAALSIFQTTSGMSGTESASASDNEEGCTLGGYRPGNGSPEVNIAKEGWVEIEDHRDPGRCCGVDVDDHTGKVKSLDLSGHNLQGHIPASIIALTALEELLLKDNKLEGTLPDLSMMKSLIMLDVSNNPGLTVDEKIVNAVNNRRIGRQKAELEALVEFRDAYQHEWQSQPMAMNDGWKEAWAVVHSQGLGCLVGQHFGVRDSQHGFVSELTLSECNLVGRIPSCIGAFTKITRLRLDSNKLTGALPDMSPLVSLQELLVNDNPDLFGSISIELLCRWQRANFSGCKQRWQCNADEKTMGVGWMQFPFIVGVSFSSFDIGSMTYLRQYCDIDPSMLITPPAKGDPTFEMTATHGEEWCAWQEVWLKGLERLRNRRVYVLVSEKERKYFPMLMKYLPREGIDGRTFEEKFLDTSFDEAR